jgi:hypothetical protein
MLFALAGLFYALLFWAVTFKHPKIALLLIFASAPFQNDISGGGPIKFSLAEVNLLLSVPLFFAKGRPIRFGPIGFPILIYLAVCTFASLLNWRSTSLVSLIQMTLYYAFAVIMFAALVKSEKDFRLALDGLIVVCVLLAIIGIVSRSNYYLGLHKNGVGASLASGLVVAAELLLATTNKRRRKFYAVALGIISCGLLLSLSRGAWVAAAVGLFCIFALRRQFAVMIKVGAITAPLIAICWMSLPKEQRGYALGFDRQSYSINARYLNIAEFKRHFRGNEILGDGVGLRKEIDATNIFWLTLAETGVVGLLALLLVQFVFIATVWTTQSNMDRSSTLFSVLAIAAALVLGRFAHGMFDHYWGRGPIMIAWAAAGMAMYAWYAKRRFRLLARRGRIARQRQQFAYTHFSPAATA